MSDKNDMIEEAEISQMAEEMAPPRTKESEYLELAQRLKAEFENYKKRNAEVVTQSFENGVAHTVEKLLPVMDSFKQARANITDEQTLKGLDLIYAQILTAFEEIGVSKIEAEGKMFDPNFHNAVLVGQDDSKPDGMILNEFQEGFILKNDKVIRHSVVQINKLN
jgi:molecular chaperone GrpE